MSKWFISEEGNPEDGFIWNLLHEEDENRAVLKGQFFNETFADEMLEAAKWREAFLSGMVKLAMDGVVIDANTGLQWKRPKGLKSYGIKTEKTKQRKRNS